MIKITKTYEDYNGTERTEDFYFHLTEAEVMEMQLSATGGLGEQIRRIVAAQDGPAIVKIFKDVVLKAYGVKTPDGKRFIKNDEVRDDFEQCPAYSLIFMELATNDVKAAEFINGIIPANLKNKMQATEAKNTKE